MTALGQGLRVTRWTGTGNKCFHCALGVFKKLSHLRLGSGCLKKSEARCIFLKKKGVLYLFWSNDG